MLSKKALQQLLGQFPHPWMHRRELSCIFFKSYQYVHALSERDVSRIPVLVSEELVVAGLFIGLSHANVRWPVSTRISSTDASLQKRGGLKLTRYRLSQDVCTRSLFTKGNM